MKKEIIENTLHLNEKRGVAFVIDEIDQLVKVSFLADEFDNLEKQTLADLTKDWWDQDKYINGADVLHSLSPFTIKVLIELAFKFPTRIETAFVSALCEELYNRY